MPHVALPRIGTVAAWRREARRLAEAGLPAEAVTWGLGDAGPDLLADLPPERPAERPSDPAPPPASARPIRLPREAVEGIETALLHSDPQRFARGYGVLVRLASGGLRWGDRGDPAMKRLLDQAQAARREIHRMHAFVRFTEIASAGPRRAFAAWYEPAHPVEEAALLFFARRFGDMDWAIATPRITARCTEGALALAETTDTTRPPPDATAALWLTYYANIFNPARLAEKAMQSHMPKRYWQNLPEAELIPTLLKEAEGRVRAMHKAAPSTPPARAAAIARQRRRPPEP